MPTDLYDGPLLTAVALFTRGYFYINSPDNPAIYHLKSKFVVASSRRQRVHVAPNFSVRPIFDSTDRIAWTSFRR